MDYVRVEIVSLSLVPSGGGTCAIVLREVNGDRFLPVIIGLLEAQSIAVRVQGLPTPRPLTHDLMANIMSEMGAKIQSVAIEELRDGTFYGSIRYDKNGESRRIDSRPSDAIGLAVRVNVPILVSESVMQEAGATPEGEGLQGAFDTSEFSAEEDEQEQEPTSFASPIDQLEYRLKKAIEIEDYEKAAEIRDEIKRLKSEQSN